MNQDIEQAYRPCQQRDSSCFCFWKVQAGTPPENNKYILLFFSYSKSDWSKTYSKSEIVGFKSEFYTASSVDMLN